MSRDMVSREALVVYHGPSCLDGLMSAAIAKMRLPHAEFMVGVYQHEPDYDVFRDRDIFILDFSYNTEVMDKICKVAKFVVCVDHHKTAHEALKDFKRKNFIFIYDVYKSGAGLTWDLFYPNELLPDIVKYVQDRDIWKWEYVETEAVTAALYSYPSKVEVMYNFLSAGKTQLDQLRHEGKALIRARRLEIEKTLAYSTRIISWGLENGDIIKVPIINCPPALTSEIGNILSEQFPFAIMYFDQKNYRNFSLRSSSKNPEHVDVSTIASLYGGGGHKHAAGFKQHIDNYEIIEYHA